MSRKIVPAGFSTVLLLLFLQLFTGGVSVAFAGPAPDPISLYGEKISFDVFREGEKVGRHYVVFSRTSPQDLSVTARFELKITFLTIPVYQFLYRSSAVWRDGRLEKLVARIDDDGEKSTVSALTEGQQLGVSGPKGQQQWRGPLYPTNHWNAGVVSQKRVLNTLNGEISRVDIAAQGVERIRAQGRWILATRYQYSGDIDTTVWYDDDGRWVKMRFPAKNGSIIDYECTLCGLGTVSKAAAN